MFSPDDRYIVSGGEKAVCIWDAVMTGGIVAGPFQGHTSVVRIRSRSRLMVNTLRLAGFDGTKGNFHLGCGDRTHSHSWANSGAH